MNQGMRAKLKIDVEVSIGMWRDVMGSVSAFAVMQLLIQTSLSGKAWDLAQIPRWKEGAKELKYLLWYSAKGPKSPA